MTFLYTSVLLLSFFYTWDIPPTFFYTSVLLPPSFTHRPLVFIRPSLTHRLPAFFYAWALDSLPILLPRSWYRRAGHFMDSQLRLNIFCFMSASFLISGMTFQHTDCFAPAKYFILAGLHIFFPEHFMQKKRLPIKVYAFDPVDPIRERIL